MRSILPGGADRAGDGHPADWMAGMRLLRRAMPEDEFWSLVDTMQGGCDDDSVERLTAALTAAGRKQAFAFQERLALVLHDLDREVLARQPVRFVDDPDDAEPIPLSDDTFLYLRAGIVARGRSIVAAVLADPTLLASGRWEECEELLYVAEEVADDDIDTKVSYESGSNEVHWSPRQEPVREDWDQGTRPVWVHCRDLGERIDGQRSFADGRVEALVTYLSPLWLSGRVLEGLTTSLSKPVAISGGLPPELCRQVEVQVDFGGEWQLAPVNLGVGVDDYGNDGVLTVRTGVNAAQIREWPASRRQETLLAIGAASVLHVLPPDHAARPALTALWEAGRGHLPV
jgi:hypothetical protein